MAGAFSLRLSWVTPDAVLCNWAKAVLTWATDGCRATEAELAAASRAVFVFDKAVVSEPRPSCWGLTCVSACSEDLRAAASAHAAAVASDVGCDVVAVLAWVGELVELDDELVPQPARASMSAAAATVPVA